MSDWQAAVVAAIEAAGSTGSAPFWTSAGASSLNELWRLDVRSARYFVKLNDASRLAMFEAEADGLRALSSALRVPAPVATGRCGARTFLAMEWLDLGKGSCGAALGAALARLHRVRADAFGWHRDNTIGTTPQANARDADWISFFRARRLAPQLELASRNGHRGALAALGDKLLDALPAFFRGYVPVPSLLHGDLWGGNWACSRADDAPVVYDPACYFGDREADLAMTELFGGFPPSFYRAYADAWPLDAGYTLRKPLYNLYHVLNHLNLFGGGYYAQATSMLESLVGASR